MIRKIEEGIRQHQMIEPGDHVIAGVSGGADSMCLLLVLLRLREVFQYCVSVVHIEHGIRGEAAMRDAEFVRHFCEERSIKCHIRHYQVPAYARAHGMSEEEAGRYLRYKAFREEKERFPGRQVKIAVAHNLEDQAETMLFHLARGTGIHGLAGIAPVQGDIIRPLLQTRREEIEAYLAQVGQDFCRDATNEMDVYTRNQLRHQVFPVLQKINSCAAEHMYQTAEQLREIDNYLKKQAAAARESCCRAPEDGHKWSRSRLPSSGESCCRAPADCVRIDKEEFLHLEPVIQKEMLYQLLCMQAGSSRDLTREHVGQVRELFDKQNGRQVQLPYRMLAVRVYDGVELRTVKDAENIKNAENVQDLKKQFTFRIIEDVSEHISEHMSQISKKKYTKCFDYDKIKNGFCVRSRQPGDYLTIDSSGSHQKLKKYLVNEKVPVKERERLLLLADGAHIMWVVGYRISSYYRVDEHTRRILEVTFCGGREDGETDSGNDTGGRGKCTDCRDCRTDQ